MIDVKELTWQGLWKNNPALVQLLDCALFLPLLVQQLMVWDWVWQHYLY